MASVVFRLSQVPPPTPPKIIAERIKHAERFLEDEYDLETLQQDFSRSMQQPSTNLDTPPQSSPQHSDCGLSKQTKEVKFLAQPFLDDKPFGLRRLPSSKTQKCAKSILKPHTPSPCNDSNRNPFFCTEDWQKAAPTFAEMIQSIVQMLAGTDPTSKLDAYRVLLQSLQAHEELPDRKALRDKLPLLEGFIQRDIMPKAIDTVSKALSRSALKLVIILIETYAASSFDGTFLAFIFEYTTSMLKQEHPPKDLALHCMQILTQSHVYLKGTQPERFQELLVNLETIPARISGMNVHRLRLTMYRTLSQRYSALMIDMTSRWLPHVFHGMLSDNTDMRSRAIDAAVAAATAINSRSFSQSVAGLLHQESSENTKYSEHFEKRLVQLLQKGEESQSIPRIWSAIMLLLRGSPTLAEKWLCSTGWLKILEKCFNSSNTKLTMEALLAWDRTISAFGSSLPGKVHALKTLRAPIVGLLQRSMLAKLKARVLSTYCTLLYYAFAPGISPENATSCWKLLVHDIVQQVVSRPAVEVHALGQIVSALFYESEVKIWNQTRGLETAKTPLTLSEVPRLDPAWVRKHIATICQTVTPLLLTVPYTTPGTSREDLRFWSSLLSTLSEAGIKEVMVSTDAKKALAEVINMLYRLRQAIATAKGPKDQISATSELLVWLAAEIINVLSPAHFADNILLRTQNGSFEAVLTTPSRHGSSHSRRCQSPLIAFVELMINAFGTTEAQENITNEFRKIMRISFGSRTNASSKLTMLEECTQVLARSPITRTAAVAEIGKITLNHALLHDILDLAIPIIRDAASALTEHPRAGAEIGKMLTILQGTLRFADSKSLDLGRVVYGEIGNYARAAAGDAAVVIALNEPLIDIINTQMSEFSLPTVLSSLKWVLEGGVAINSQKTMDHARKALWDQAPATHDLSGLSWLKTLYTAIGNALGLSYAQMDLSTQSSITTFISTIAGFLRVASQSPRGTIPGSELFLWHVSPGLCQWVEDAAGRVFVSHAGPKELSAAVNLRTLWTHIMALISRLPLKSNTQLRGVENLLCAGFRSRSKTIANSTISTWNATFGAEDNLEYPRTLAHVLRRLQSLTELSLPSFPPANLDKKLSTDGDAVAELDERAIFPWLAADEDSQVSQERASASARFPLSTARTSLPHSVGLVVPSSAVRVTKTALVMSKAVQERTTPARMRHQDSQVDFVAVGSSPQDPQEAESQLLTERQKEVRHRQEADNILFKDIRSSASPTTPQVRRMFSAGANSVPDNSALMTSDADEIQLDNEDQASDGELPAMIDSSPIERARKGRSPHTTITLTTPREIFRHFAAEDDMDIPSSPPEIVKHVFATQEIGKHATLLPVATGENPRPIDEADIPGNTLENANITEEVNGTDIGMEANIMASDSGDQCPTIEVPVQGTAVREESSAALEPPSTETDHVAIPNSAEDEVRVDSVINKPEVLVQDSIIGEHGLPDQTSSSSASVVTDSAETQVMVPDNLDHVQSPSLSQRLVATFVTVPLRSFEQAYEDHSQESVDLSDRSESETRTLRIRKRKGVAMDNELIKKARMNTSQESVIRCRTPSENTPSLRELAIQSSLFVDPSRITTTPDHSPQKAPTSTVSRKRGRPSLNRDHLEDDNPGATLTPAGKAGRKRVKETPPAQSTQQVQSIELSQSSQKRTRQRKAVSPLARGTPSMRLRSSNYTRSPLASANTSFAETDIVSAAPSSSTPAVDVPNNPAKSSPWNDTTVDITANLSSAAPPSTEQPPQFPPTIEAENEDEEAIPTSKAIPATALTAPVALAMADAAPVEIIPPSLEQVPTTPTIPSEDIVGTTVAEVSAEAPSAPSILDCQSGFESNVQPTPSTALLMQADRFTTPAPAKTQKPAEDATLSPATPLTPTTFARSFLGRLRGLVSDCKNLLLGPGYGDDGVGIEAEEVEEMQELAHELQGELMRARRRGRVQGS